MVREMVNRWELGFYIECEFFLKPYKTLELIESYSRFAIDQLAIRKRKHNELTEDEQQGR